ncbi:MAG: acetylglutamate kinase [Actinomycetota bacterium]
MNDATSPPDARESIADQSQMAEASGPVVTRPPEVRQRTVAKARVLLEALPYMKEHSGKVVVVKLGGAAMEDSRLAETFAEDIALLRLAGIRPIVVHGGGPQISALSKRLGIEPRFVDGLRVTDAETLDLARMVLVGKLNKEIVSRINRQGIPASGVSGEDGNLLVAAPKQGPVGLGFVGEITRVDSRLLHLLMEEFVPVVASTATDGGGQTYNVNADEVASAIAVALGAEKLIFLTDVPGLYDDTSPEASLLSELSLVECEHLLETGGLVAGMIPKVRALAHAMRDGVPKAHILDGRVEHALILELFTPEGLGTMVVHDVLPPEEAP